MKWSLPPAKNTQSMKSCSRDWLVSQSELEIIFVKKREDQEGVRDEERFRKEDGEFSNLDWGPKKAV